MIVQIFDTKKADTKKWCVRYLSLKDDTFKDWYITNHSEREYEDYINYLLELVYYDKGQFL